MFVSWGSVVHRRRWLVAVAIVLFTVVGGAWGAGVFGALSQGGYEDPSSEAARATATAKEALGRQGGDLVVIYTAPDGGTIDDPALGEKITAKLRALPKDKVDSALSYWDTRAPQFADADKQRGLAVITMRSGDENERISQYPELRDQLQVDGVRTQIAGFVPMAAAINETTQSDLIKAEIVSVPLTLVLLVVIFGGLVAASLPVAVGGLAILGSLGVLRIIASFTEVSTFAVNVASLLGLGLAIDYGLFMVGRFREEIAAGRSTPDAVRRTVGTAGRTVAFSATLLIIALAGLMLFPQGFLKSVAYGGMSAVGIAALVSLTLLPALLGMLGKRVDSLGLPWRKKAKSAEDEGRGWRRLAGGVMKRPVTVAVPIVAGLLLLGAPFLGASFGAVTEKVLPASDATRQATETLNSQFPGLANDGAQLVLKGRDGKAPDQQALGQFIAAVDNVPGVSAVQPTGAAKDVVTLTAKLPGDSMSDAAKEAVKAIRAVQPPAGTDLLVGGMTAQVTDSLDAIIEQLPLMAVVVVGATLLLMFLAFGSLLLPIKAVVMSALSLSATFGVLVWVFQDGHLADWIGVTPGPLEAGIVVLMAAVVFGLSTDYEVFLMSRMVEARAKGASTEEAVSTGIAKTGRVISAAAILLIVVTGAFAFSNVAMMRFVGVGMILALALDATIVRMLLVPAVMKLLGNAAWWAPGPLKRFQQRVGLQESEDLPEGTSERERSPQPVG
ncbi:MMPL family transporter [Allokutzneria oryzae]|uniref:MMPL family transporter n=1 Tax=Allokutzneria oryzae TaxID=1378989 RepID=A0ABV6A0E4_9PSEU